MNKSKNWYVKLGTTNVPTEKVPRDFLDLDGRPLPAPGYLRIAHQNVEGEDFYFLFELDNKGYEHVSMTHKNLKSAMEQAELAFNVKSDEWGTKQTFK